MTGSPAPAATAAAARDLRPARCPRRPLGAYDRDGRRRELVARPGAYGSVLVIDVDARALAGRGLVAPLRAAPGRPPRHQRRPRAPPRPASRPPPPLPRARRQRARRLRAVPRRGGG